MALRYFIDVEALPKEPSMPGQRALYARDLFVLREGLVARLEGALTALRVK